MKEFLVLTISAAAWAIPLPPRAAAAPLGSSIPANCVAHTSFDGGADVPGDYRCAGLTIEFHTAGVDRSPYPIWAGQWLFVDGEGEYRVGSCTFNRGVHPSILGPSVEVPQAFPNDPSGAKSAYLTWRYGDTTDELTAAAMWAVLHYYAQDAAGRARSDDPQAPLVPTLATVAVGSGRADIEARAEALDAEAARFAAPWTLTLDVDDAGQANVAVRSPSGPIAGTAVMLYVGDAAVAQLTTGEDGRAATTLPVGPAMPALRATAAVPGKAVAYRGPPAVADYPFGAQILVTGGAPELLEASVDVPPPTTTTTAATTTSTTTDSPTTTTDVPTTMQAPTPTTESPTTTEPATSSSASVPATSSSTTTTPVTSPTGPIVAPPPTLPVTGAGEGYAAYIGTAALVCGVGLIGAVRRRQPDDGDSFWS